MKNIVFTGGGTAGHIMPNIAIIEELKNYNIYYFGTNGMEKEIISQYPNIQFIEIEAIKLIRSLTFKNLLIPFKLAKSINKIKKQLQKINPVLIFSKGGYVSVPTCLAGSKLNIPIITHESDYTVGLANKIISKKSKYICCSFQETSRKIGKNSIFTGSPIRKKILCGNAEVVKNRHKLNYSKPLILIIGGSLGAQAINKTIWQNLQKLSEKYTIIHIVGKNKINKEIKESENYIQLEFVSDVENYFKASDLIISRAGSNTIFELLALAKPMLLIPLPKKSSRGDQIINAKCFYKNNFGNILMQEDLTIDTLIKKINETLQNKSLYIKSIKESKNHNGTDTIVKLIQDCEINI